MDWWRTRSVEWYGWCGTAIWIGIIILIMADNHEALFTLKLNELGDFLAGAFGPVGFGWLVLGYIQQGKELKLSSEALSAQAVELEKSVQQQTIMAKAATEQIEHSKNELRIRERELSQALSPRFQFYPDDSKVGSVVDESVRGFYLLANMGREAAGLILDFDPAIGNVSSINLGFIAERGEPKYFSLTFRKPHLEISGICTIQYIRMDAVKCVDSFVYRIIPTEAGISFTKAASPDA
jgi:hypothetical protein